jgi:predicted dehydrogenase
MRALVVGLGVMGRRHRKVLLDLGYDVVTVDPLALAADYTTIAQALMEEPWRCRSERITVAAVAVPIPSLVDAAFQVAGTPKVMVEKPFAATRQDALMLAAYLKDCESDVGVGYVERFNPVVRRLQREMRECAYVRGARFIRHNSREGRRAHPGPHRDHETDLLAHDVDLASYLGLWAVEPTFDAKLDNTEQVRRVEVDVQRTIGSETGQDGSPETIVADLMDHDLERDGRPLHAMWHSFLTNGEHLARPIDAVDVLERAELILRHGAAPEGLVA